MSDDILQVGGLLDPNEEEVPSSSLRFGTKMGEDNHLIPYHQINRYLFDEVLNTGLSDKKRKLEALQPELPSAKHKCCHQQLTSDPLVTFHGGRDVENLIVKVLQENQEMQIAEYGSSDAESAKGSNSFVGESDTAMSSYNEAKFETEVAKAWFGDRPSTSSASWDCDTATGSLCSSETATASLGAGKEKLHDMAGDCNPFPTCEEEHMLEFPPYVDYSCSKYGSDGIDLHPEKDMNELLYSNEVNPNIFVLSSGRWNIEQGVEQATRKPTIDQEFEQYFSTLML